MPTPSYCHPRQCGHRRLGGALSRHDDVQLGGRSIHVVHDVHDLALDPVAPGIDIVISGHSHKPGIATVGGVLYLNPGSAGPRRFSLPITLAIMELDETGMRPVIHELIGG